MRTAQVRPDFGNLFDGSARLGLLLGATEMPWTATVPFLKAFPEELNRYLELSVATDTGEVGLMTRGEGKDFSHRFARVLESNGITEEELRRFLVRAQHFDHLNMFVKVEIGPNGISEFSYYFRRRPDLPVAHAWLNDSGVPPNERAILEPLCDALEVRSVQFLATSLSRKGGRLDKAYLCPAVDEATWNRIQSALSLAGASEAHRETLNEQPQEWAGRTLFVTLGWEGGKRRPGAKLYIHGANHTAVEAVMQSHGADAHQIARAQLMCELHERTVHDYAGFDLRPDHSMRTKVYAYHQDA